MEKIVLGRFYYDKKEDHVVQVRQKANTSSVLATRHSPTPFFVKASDLREASVEECDLYKEETKQRKDGFLNKVVKSKRKKLV